MRPPAGAGEDSVTVPVELTPPVREVGFTENEASVGAVTEIGAVKVADIRLAVIVPF